MLTKKKRKIEFAKTRYTAYVKIYLKVKSFRLKYSKDFETRLVNYVRKGSTFCANVLKDNAETKARKILYQFLGACKEQKDIMDKFVAYEGKLL